MKPSPRLVVFSDVDRVLLKPGGSAFTEAAKALKRLGSEAAPLVLCSSRTRAEIEAIQQQLGISHPFVCESGAAVFVPAGYFGFDVPNARDLAGYQAVEFGWPYAEVVQTLHRSAERLRIQIVGFSAMSVEEVARDCHLPLLQARLAKLRQYSERFRILDPRETTRHRLFRALKAAGLRCVTGERYDHVGAPVDNSIGVTLLCNLYQRAYGGVLTVGLADPMADDKLLRLVNRRVVVCDDPTRGRIDVVDWAEGIVDIVQELRCRESSRLPTMREDRR